MLYIKPRDISYTNYVMQISTGIFIANHSPCSGGIDTVCEWIVKLYVAYITEEVNPG